MKAATSNKGRITRQDQAWGPAHAEYALRACEAVVSSDQAACELSRITDVELAEEMALREYLARAEYGPGWADRLAIEEEAWGSRYQNVEQAWEEALCENEERGVAAYEANIAGRMAEHLTPASFTYSGDKNSIVPYELSAGLAPAMIKTQSLVLPIKLIQAAMIVAAKGDLRYYLNSVFIHGVDGEVRICSTDGHRLIVSRFELEKGQVLPDWAEDGLLIPRDELAQALPMLARNAIIDKAYKHIPSIVIDYAKGNAAIDLRSANGFAQFRVKPIDGKFPDYARVMASNAATLARSGNEALTASAIQAKYLKSVAEVAEKIDAKAVHSFVNGDSGSSAFFTFDGAPDTVLVVMPMKTDTGGISDGVARIVGAEGLKLSITALKAHVTRTTRLLLEAKSSAEEATLKAKKASLQDRIAHLISVTSSGPKQLSAPATV